MNGTVLAFGGIGEVATSKAHRGKGLAPRVLEDCIAYMQQRGLALAVLHTSQPPLQQYYAKHGFATVRMHYARLAVSKEALSALHGKGASSGDIVQLAADTDGQSERLLAELDGIYTEHAVRFNGTVLRDHPDYWRHWVLDDCTKPSASLWALSDEGHAKAYLAVRIRSNSATNGKGCEGLAFVCAAVRIPSHPHSALLPEEQVLEVREFFNAGPVLRQELFRCLLAAALLHHDAQLPDAFQVVLRECATVGRSLSLNGIPPCADCYARRHGAAGMDSSRGRRGVCRQRVDVSVPAERR